MMPDENNRQRPVLIVVPKYFPGKLEPAYDYIFPLGLAYVASALIHKGLSVEVLNLNHERGDSVDILKRTLDNSSFFAVCTGGNSLIFNELRKIIVAASAHPSHPLTVLGGIVVTSEPDVVFEAIRPDYAVMGEGEDAAPELLSQLIQGKRPESIPGTIFSKDGITVKNPVAPTPKELDSIHYPALDKIGYREWLDNQTATGMVETSKIYPVIGSRGCPFKCTFCYHYEKYRERSLDSIFKELEENIPRYDVNAIGLYDDCFSLNMDRLKEFCSRIWNLQEKLGRRLAWSVQVTVKNISSEILQLLKDAGCTSISFGFESFSQSVLNSMRKPIRTEEIQNALRLTLEYGLVVQANFIFGDVAETPASYSETLDFWKRSCQGQVNLDIIRLYPGSPIYEQSVERGIIKDRLAFLESDILSVRPINFTAGMSDAQYLSMLMDVFETRRRFGVFKIPHSVKKAKRNYDVSVKCPFCKTAFVCTDIPLVPRLGGLSFASFNCVCRECRRRFIVMSLVGYLWMKSKSLRYRLVKLFDPSNTGRLDFLAKGLEKRP